MSSAAIFVWGFKDWWKYNFSNTLNVQGVVWSGSTMTVCTSNQDLQWLFAIPLASYWSILIYHIVKGNVQFSRQFT